MIKIIKYLVLSLLTFLYLSTQSCKKEGNNKEINLGLFKVEANTNKGFSWPYYLNVPNSAPNTTLLVLPNNTGYPSDNQQDHDLAAKDWAVWGGEELAKELQVPVLVPTFPRPDNWFGECYTHALSRGTIETTIQGIQRIDLQLIAMIKELVLEIRFLLWAFLHQECLQIDLQSCIQT
jgi:hypothetical protein